MPDPAFAPYRIKYTDGPVTKALTWEKAMAYLERDPLHLLQSWTLQGWKTIWNGPVEFSGVKPEGAL